MAVGKILNAKVKYVNEGYTQEYNTLKSDELTDLTVKTFIQIITGEARVDSFDQYVQDWYAQGGQKLTDKANEIRQARR